MYINMDYDPTTENENPRVDDKIDNDDEEEVNMTRPFRPGAASTPYQTPGAALTPYHGSEELEMTHLGSEQSGLDDKNPLLPQDQKGKSWKTITDLYPDASPTYLEAYYDPRSKRLMVKMAGADKKAYPLYTEERLTKRLRLNQKLSQEISFALGQTAEEKLVQQRQAIREAAKD